MKALLRLYSGSLKALIRGRQSISKADASRHLYTYTPTHTHTHTLYPGSASAALSMIHRVLRKLEK